MRRYLGEQGLVDERTWAAFRVEAVADADLARLLTPTQRRGLRPGGIWLPTFDPRAPAVVAGLVRLTPAQNQHRFISAPVGLAAPPDIDRHDRVVLCDNPLLTLRLHQAGVADVALVEDPVVLMPLVDWLRARRVVTITTAKRGDLPLPAGVVAAGSGRIIGTLAHASDAVFAVLGLDPAVVRRPAERPALSPVVVHELAVHAQARLDAGEAAPLLSAFGAAIPDLVRAYRMGFLPSTFRNALSRTAQRMLAGGARGNALTLAAVDPAGVVVDLLCVHGAPSGPHTDGLWSEPRGMLAPELIRGLSRIVVTESPTWLFRLFAQGRRDVLLLRGPADAQANAARIAAAGVREVIVRCYRQGDAIAAALAAGGLQVTIDRTPVLAGGDPVPEVVRAESPPETEASPSTVGDALVAAPSPLPGPAPAGALAIVGEEDDGRILIAEAGAVRYTINLRTDGGTARRVVIRAHGKSCRHDLDDAVAAQVERTAGNAARQVGVPAAVISGHLLALFANVREREDARDRLPVVEVSAADRATAEATLAAPDLLDRIAADLTALGWIGEESTKHILYLAAISRLLPRPVWAVYQAAAGATPWASVAVLASVTPPEDVVTLRHLTGAALRQADRSALRHRLLVVDQAEALRPDAALTLRVLHERGGMAGAAAGLPTEVRGPVAVLAAATGPIDRRCRDAFLPVTVDESPAQTASILAAQRHGLATRPAGAVATAAIIARHHALQRCLERLPVVIPCADRIVFPASRVRHRDEQRWFLAVVAASALLHQRQRRREDGAVVATEADVAVAIACTAGLIGGEARSIGHDAEHFLHTLWARGLVAFTLPDLAGIFPDWTRWKFRAVLDDLCAFGHVTTETKRQSGGRGQRRTFALVRQSGVAPSGIHLRPIGAEAPIDSELAKLAETGGLAAASLSPVRTGT